MATKYYVLYNFLNYFDTYKISPMIFLTNIWCIDTCGTVAVYCILHAELKPRHISYPHSSFTHTYWMLFIVARTHTRTYAINANSALLD